MAAIDFKTNPSSSFEPVSVLDTSSSDDACFQPDQQMLLRIWQRLKQKHLPALRDLGLQFSEGELILSGRLRSFHEKQIAISVSRSIDGIVTVVDRIEVDPVEMDVACNCQNFAPLTRRSLAAK